MAEVEIRYWAAARSAAGRERETVTADDCAQALAVVRRRSVGTELERVLAVSSFLVDGIRRDPAHLDAVAAPAVLEVLPPFAGG